MVRGGAGLVPEGPGDVQVREGKIWKQKTVSKVTLGVSRVLCGQGRGCALGAAVLLCLLFNLSPC